MLRLSVCYCITSSLLAGYCLSFCVTLSYYWGRCVPRLLRYPGFGLQLASPLKRSLDHHAIRFELWGFHCVVILAHNSFCMRPTWSALFRFFWENEKKSHRHSTTCWRPWMVMNELVCTQVLHRCLIPSTWYNVNEWTSVNGTLTLNREFTKAPFFQTTTTKITLRW